MKPTFILFDVNETLLDMRPVRRKVNNILGSKRAFHIWFGMLLQYSLVDNCTGNYHDFPTIAKATLDMAAKALDSKINEEEKSKTLRLLNKLSAYADVKKGLQLLKDAGFRLAAFTNSPPLTLNAQLKHSGLEKYFEKTLSVDTIQKYKPAQETYQYATRTLNVPACEVLMVAAHGWDIAGAIQAGMQTAFIERKGQSLYSLSAKPSYVCKDLIALSKTIRQ